MRKIIFLKFLFFILLFSITIKAQVIDSFSDGNFTSSPVWNGDSGSWQVVTDSDVSTGATGSYTLRLNHTTSESGSQYLSTQISSMASSLGQSWSFWIGRRAQAYTVANNVEVWLYANESNLENTTVDGYAILIGDDTGSDEIRLVRMTNGASASTIITSSSALSNGLLDIGFMVRVTRSSDGSWTLYTSTLPTSNGSGAIATDIPNSTNTNISQGSGFDNTYSIEDNSYFGIVAVHSSGANARAAVELDQIYFDLSDTSPLPVELISFTASIINKNILLNWTTSTEQNNYGFEIERSAILSSLNYENWEKIGFVQGSGNSNSPKEYSFTDNTLTKSGKYAYRLKQIDTDGTFEYFKEVEVDFVMLDKFSLEQNFPNPFNPTTVISYQIPVNSNVSLKLYDVLGNEVATLVNEYKEAGRYKVELNVGEISLSSGIYFYKLQAGEFSQIKKMILAK